MTAQVEFPNGVRVTTAKELARELRLRQAAGVRAQQIAEREVKAALQREGLRLWGFTRCEIIERAKAYLAEHPELRSEALATVKEWKL